MKSSFRIIYIRGGAEKRKELIILEYGISNTSIDNWIGVFSPANLSYKKKFASCELNSMSFYNSSSTSSSIVLPCRIFESALAGKCLLFYEKNVY